MSIRRGKTQTDYVRLDEEYELEQIRGCLWGAFSPSGEPAVKEIEEWTYWSNVYEDPVDDKEDRTKERLEKRNMERTYTSVCKTHHASYSGRYCGQRNTRKSCTNYRGRR